MNGHKLRNKQEIRGVNRKIFLSLIKIMTLCKQHMQLVFNTVSHCHSAFPNRIHLTLLTMIIIFGSLCTKVPLVHQCAYQNTWPGWKLLGSTLWHQEIFKIEKLKGENSYIEYSVKVWVRKLCFLLIAQCWTFLFNSFHIMHIIYKTFFMSCQEKQIITTFDLQKLEEERLLMFLVAPLLSLVRHENV